MNRTVDHDVEVDDARPAEARSVVGRARTLPKGMARNELGLVSGRDLFDDPDTSTDALALALAWLRSRQQVGQGHLLVGPDEIDHWVDEPLERILRAAPDRRTRAGIATLRRRLTSDLSGKVVAVNDVHGPVAPGRWWFSEALDEIVTVDGWEQLDRGLPEVDLVSLVLAARHTGGSGGLGGADAVGDLLTTGWSPDERHLLGAAWNANPELRPSTPVLLAWINELADSCTGTDLARPERELLEQLAADGLLDSPAIDVGLRVEEEAVALDGARRARVAVARAADRTAEAHRNRRASVRTVALVAAASALWAGGVVGLDISAMTDTGLLSILRPSAYLALVVLLGCFSAELASRRPSTWRLAAPVVALVAAIHGTPALLYGTLRYSWAWKHLGIIDFIHRHGAVDPEVKTLGVYHNWPGFFAANSALTDQFGLRSAAGYARFWPLLANLAVIPILLYVFRGLRGGANRRTSWLAVVIFLVANWIGQDYFSPQSFAFLMYLVVIGVVLQFTGTELRDTDRVGAAWPRRWSIAVALLASAAVITSHQVSPVVLLVALVALSVTRQARAARVAIAVAGLALLWSTTGAWDFLSGNVASLVEGLGQPVSNADQNLVDQGRLSSGQALVSTMGRVTLVAVAALAACGVLRELRRRRVDGAGLALLVAPGSLLFANTFGGEIAFRVYLFALPFLAWYAALALWPAIEGAGATWTRRRAWGRGVAALVATCVLLTGFLYGYFGKDAYYTFSRHEIEASAYVLDHAPPDALLVTITANYPGQFERYEHLTYVPIASEPSSSWKRIIDDPVRILSGWTSGDEYSKGYILLTRSQEREVESMGVLPPGSVARIRRALDASPRFRTVYASPEAQVYELVPS